ncbi:MAG: hypothetical protein QF654_15150 [Alphaproteobacteria bacterium]|jgi:type II secretory pathway pseudopilin PulG|nr:hypothetical protein [Alphaproteobacteria bacterium]
MKKSLLAPLAVVLLLAGSAAPILAPALAADSDQKRAEEMAKEGIQSLLQAMELLLQTIPQYEMPVIDENGDIIIRRKHPKGEGSKPGEAPGKGKTI